MDWRYPDKPNFVLPESVDEYDRSKWIATGKVDDWRLVFNAGLSFDSWSVKTRHNKELKISGDVFNIILPEFNRLAEIEGQFVLDLGLMGVRNSHYEPRLVLFDIHYKEGIWFGNVHAEERWKVTKEFADKHDLLLPPEPVAEETIGDFYNRLNHGGNEYFLHEELEGIVLKRKDSMLIGSRHKCKENPLWLKMKWRNK